jgi:N-acetylmuramoyl-L-alanine amidase
MRRGAGFGAALLVVFAAGACASSMEEAAPSTVLTVPTTESTTTTSSTTMPTTTPTVTLPQPNATGTTGASTSSTIAAPSPGGSLAGRVVVIDPGHNGGNGNATSEINRQVEAGGFRKACDTTGTSTNDGYSESAFNWDVSNRLAAVLRAGGATVVLTRDSDDGVGPCIDRRAGIGNFARADVAVSVHADGSSAGNRGFHILVPGSLGGFTDDIAGPSREYAALLREELPAAGMPPSNYVGSDGIMVRTDLGGLNLSDVPKVFVESGNMRDATDAALLTNPEFRQRWAEQIAAATTRFLSGR